MIDFDAISALATSALTVHCPDNGASAGQNGCDDPEIIALDVLGIRDANILAESTAFCLGFEFALRLGALLATNPLQRPDPEALIDTHSASARRLYSDGASEIRRIELFNAAREAAKV